MRVFNNEQLRDFHFFASSRLEWKVDEDVEKLIKDMNKSLKEINDSYKGDFSYVLYYVPLNITKSYKINNYLPSVFGTIFLGEFKLKK